MLDYTNMAAGFHSHDSRLTVTEDDVSLCFLPLSHVFERAWTYYILYRGAKNVYIRDQADIKKAMQTVRPTVMCAVPRLYEKMHAAILAQVETAPAKKKKLFYWAVGCAEKRFLLEQEGKPVGALLKLSCIIGEKWCFQTPWCAGWACTLPSLWWCGFGQRYQSVFPEHRHSYQSGLWPE